MRMVVSYRVTMLDIDGKSFVVHTSIKETDNTWENKHSEEIRELQNDYGKMCRININYDVIPEEEIGG